MAGFYYKGQMNGMQSPGTIELIIANSETITVGGAVKVVSGYAAAATAGAKILGICVGFKNAKGLDLDTGSVADYDGTYTPGNIGVGSYAAASDNVTDKKIKAIIICDKNALFVNDTAANLTAAQVFGYFDLTSATQIATQAAGNVAGAFQLVGLDPDNDADASKGLFKIAESTLDAYTQS